MYSFSLFVIRTSGSLPRRPMRTSLDKSEERAAVYEKAYSRCEDVESVTEKKERTRARPTRGWRRRVRENMIAEFRMAVSRGVTRSGLGLVRMASPPLSHMFE
jgi:hypothetical protein